MIEANDHIGRSDDGVLGVGIVGCGLIGQRRGRVAQASPSEKVIMVADVNENKAISLAQEIGCQSTADWKSMLGNKEIDIIIVSTPNKYLMPVVVAALEAGKHVLCEKPPGRNAAETGEMVAAAQKSGKLLKIGFNHRYHPAVWKAHELFNAGAIGKPMFIRAIYGHGGRPGYDQEWRGSADLAGGGEMLDQGVHIVDLCRSFLGEFSEAYATASTYFWNLGYFADHQQLEDNAFALLRTRGGQVAQIHTSWTQWKNRFSFEIFGEAGYLRIEGLGGSYGTECLTYGRRRPESGPPIEEYFEYSGTDGSWLKEWDDFTTAIREYRQPRSNGEDGFQTMRVIGAMYESARSGKLVTL